MINGTPAHKSYSVPLERKNLTSNGLTENSTKYSKANTNMQK